MFQGNCFIQQMHCPEHQDCLLRMTRSYKEKLNIWIEVAVKNLPGTEQRLKEYASAQMSDPICSQILQYFQEGCPNKHNIQHISSPIGKSKKTFTVSKKSPIVCEKNCNTKSTIKRYFSRHQGIQRSQLRARHLVWWTGIMTQVKILLRIVLLVYKILLHIMNH